MEPFFSDQKEKKKETVPIFDEERHSGSFWKVLRRSPLLVRRPHCVIRAESPGSPFSSSFSLLISLKNSESDRDNKKISRNPARPSLATNCLTYAWLG